MAKSSKSPTPEFLATRRQRIAEMADRRLQKQRLVSAPGISTHGTNKVIVPASLPGRASASTRN
jgi:hypothetical protein